MHDETMMTCTLKDGKMTCHDAGTRDVPTMPGRMAWIIIVIAVVMLIIAAVLNHVIFSTTAPVYTFPFFGGIDIQRGTLYDISLFLFVIAPVMIIVVFIFTVKKQTKIIFVH